MFPPAVVIIIVSDACSVSKFRYLSPNVLSHSNLNVFVKLVVLFSPFLILVSSFLL